MRSAIEVEDQRGTFHVPNAPNLMGAPPQTLCGWADVEHRYVFADINCSECLTILRYCRTAKLHYDIDDDPFLDRVPDAMSEWMTDDERTRVLRRLP